MNSAEKTTQLRHLIYSELSPHIKGKVALLGLVCHGNIGDTLIAMGELEFLRDCGTNVIYKRQFMDDSPLPELPDDCTILLQGGGDFGDVWRGIHEIRIAAIDKYRNHKIIVFPQTIEYNNTAYLESDLAVISRCRDITICVRDEVSFSFARSNFPCQVLLVPDMAFFISPQRLLKYKTAANRPGLFLKRNDKEYHHPAIPINESFDKADWPTLSNPLKFFKWNLRMIGYAAGFRKRGLNVISRFILRSLIFVLEKRIYPLAARAGVEFISQYEELYLSRMHSAILSVLIDKEFKLINNSYNKNKNFFNCWFKDLDAAQLID